MYDQDARFMTRCLQLALKARGQTSPNPMVGAVIVKDHKIIAEGYHYKAGESHAEIDALKKIKFKALGATLYCNLEPCFHQGRTPPCVHQIIKSGIKKVVVAHQDPNPKVAGRSLALLKKSGIAVRVGVLKKEAQFLNRVFIKWITQNRPYVLLKVAISQDGKMTSPSRWITAPKARRRVHQIRSQFDAILVGVNTILADNPQLNVRGIRNAHQPVRIILDTHLKIPFTARIFKSSGGKVLLVTSAKKSPKIKQYQKLGAEIIFVKSTKTGLDIAALLKKLSRREITSLMIEGGAQVYDSFIRQKLVDEYCLFVSPKIIGPEGLPAFPFSLYKRLMQQSTILNVHGKDKEMRRIKC